MLVVEVGAPSALKLHDGARSGHEATRLEAAVADVRCRSLPAQLDWLDEEQGREALPGHANAGVAFKVRCVYIYSHIFSCIHIICKYVAIYIYDDILYVRMHIGYLLRPAESHELFGVCRRALHVGGAEGAPLGCAPHRLGGRLGCLGVPTALQARDRQRGGALKAS